MNEVETQLDVHRNLGWSNFERLENDKFRAIFDVVNIGLILSTIGFEVFGIGVTSLIF